MANFFKSQPTSNGLATNFIRNGNFDFWQKGTSFAAIATNTRFVDGFGYGNTSTAVHTASRSTDVPTLAQSGFQSTYSALIDCTTADASVGAGDSTVLFQMLEGFNWAQLINRTVTFSFWVKATKTGTYCVFFQTNSSSRSYVAEYTVNSTATWENKTISITLNPSGGTNDFINGIGLYLGFCLMGGSTYQTTAGAWQNGGFYCTSNQVNACDSTSNDFRVSQVMINIGGPQIFVRSGITIPGELVICQRYYEKSYELSVDPGSVSQLGRKTFIYARSGAGQDTQASERFSVRKRATPTVSLYNPTTGTINQCGGGGAYTASATSIGESGFSITASAPGDQDQLICQWIADAEI
jgi:hypothetical protein